MPAARCIQAICDLADQFYPSFRRTTSRNDTTTGHDGVFAIEESHVKTYFARFAPQTLRYNRTHTGITGAPFNFGNAKGMTFDRTLIYPHRPLSKQPYRRESVLIYRAHSWINVGQS
ncbi:hypothetical protein NLM31_30550 [Bradyrhizobium sp. CCGUVB4N]|uniref:hypothetical protein n=1 Tax=Bradyrhizobium sp. CCGUVB4N TaxID=2949631 RepID=UPI0020B1E7EC|nr:hypothetical protein [Bradyrhizobium sp. CCGUVB4N]MCP3384721.1 hypothetical protein [Bradyrhizobium sp. CCGUVB4N]